MKKHWEEYHLYLKKNIFYMVSNLSNTKWIRFKYFHFPRFHTVFAYNKHWGKFEDDTQNENINLFVYHF